MKLFHFNDTSRLLYPVRVLLFGLFIAQIIGSVLVYLSNQTLAQKLLAINAAGYGPLPGMNIDPALIGFEAAFSGGVFFALSIGAGTVLLTYGAVLLTDAFSGIMKRLIIIVLILTWALVLLLTNAGGINYGSTAFLLLIPPPIIWASLSWSPRGSGASHLPWRKTIHFLLIAALAVWWLTRINPDVFVNIKDNLLLTTRPGIKIVHLYYKYTLYPAEAFKSQAQKQINTSKLVNFTNETDRNRLARALASRGYFVIEDTADPIDLTVRKKGETFIFSHHDRDILTASIQEWRASPDDILERFSDRIDTAWVFRKMTFFLLLGVAPLVLYLVTFTGFAVLPGIFFNIRVSSILVPVMCCLFWAMAIDYLETPPSENMDRVAATRAIQSGDRKERLAALRYIYRNKLDITTFDGHKNLADTSDFAQRYWLLQNYGNIRGADALKYIFNSLQSDSPYLVCKAIEALTQKIKTSGASGLQRLLAKKLATADAWYIQFYAYKSLQEMGWQPRKSN